MLQKINLYSDKSAEEILNNGERSPLKFYGNKILYKILFDEEARSSFKGLISDVDPNYILNIELRKVKVRLAYQHEVTQIRNITNFAYFSRYRTEGMAYQNLVNTKEFTSRNDEVFVCVYEGLILATVKASYNGSIEVDEIFNLPNELYTRRSEIGEFKRLAAHPILDILSHSENREVAKKVKKIKVTVIQKVWYRAFESMKRNNKTICLAIFCNRVIEFFIREQVGVFKRVDRNINKESALYQKLVNEYDVYWTDSPHAYQMHA